MMPHRLSDASLFVLLFYVDAGARDLDAEAWQRRVDDFNDWARVVETRGEMVLAETVAPGSETRWLRADGTDTPTAGQTMAELDLAGLCVVRVRDLESALDLARRAPSLGSGERTAVRILHAGQPVEDRS